MKVWHFLHVSSQIIRKQRYRSNATTIASSSDLQIAVTSTTNQATQAALWVTPEPGLIA